MHKKLYIYKIIEKMRKAGFLKHENHCYLYRNIYTLGK